MFLTNDYTELVSRDDKLWSWDTVALPGISVQRLLPAGVFSVLGFALAAGVVQLFRLPAWGWLAVLAIGVAAGVSGYWLAGRLNADRMPLLASLVVWFDWLLIQPRKVAGFTRDVEPETLHWQVITWAPADPAWEQAFNQLKEHVR